jgi:hypothetical protein
MPLSRAETEERIDEDDGDGDDSVLTVGGYRAAYHEDADCGALIRDDRDAQQMQRREAQSAIRPPCGACILNRERPNKGGSIKHPEQRFADLLEG